MPAPDELIRQVGNNALGAPIRRRGDTLVERRQKSNPHGSFPGFMHRPRGSDVRDQRSVGLSGSRARKLCARVQSGGTQRCWLCRFLLKAPAAVSALHAEVLLLTGDRRHIEQADAPVKGSFDIPVFAIERAGRSVAPPVDIVLDVTPPFQAALSAAVIADSTIVIPTAATAPQLPRLIIDYRECREKPFGEPPADCAPPRRPGRRPGQ
jgi:hypothetical protein